MTKKLLIAVVILFMGLQTQAQKKVIEEQIIRGTDTLWLISRKNVNRLIDKVDSLQSVIDIADQQIATYKIMTDTLKQKGVYYQQIVKGYQAKDQSYEKQIKACEDRSLVAERVAKSELASKKRWRSATLIGIPLGIAAGFIAAIFIL